MTKVNPNNGNETKSEIFHGIYSNLTSFFNDFYDCPSFNFIAKVSTNK